MKFWGNLAKVKRLEKELEVTKKQVFENQMKYAEIMEELQNAELTIWKQEKELKEFDFKKYRVKDQIKHELWDKIMPAFFLEGKNLRTACEQGSVYYSSETNQWVAVDSYCVVCGEEIEVKKFRLESDALRYAAIRRILSIPPKYSTCPKCYQNYLRNCA